MSSNMLTAALRRVALADRLLVALDFDGTLAPMVDGPGDARALPASGAAVLRLAAERATRVAYISGRALASLSAVAQAPENVLLVGSHGIEFRLGGPDGAGEAPALDAALSVGESQRLDALHKGLTRAAHSVDQVWVEKKPAGFALHTRLASARGAILAQAAAKKEVAEIPGLTVREGKDVLEFSVRSATKGDALRRLRDYADATAVFFAGDDVTDEDAFATLGADDVGVKVGDGPTAAAFRVTDPAELSVVLGMLADLRHDAP